MCYGCELVLHSFIDITDITITMEMGVKHCECGTPKSPQNTDITVCVQSTMPQ